MATISPEEARALAQAEPSRAESARPPVAAVVPRDFAAPRRLSAARLEELRHALQPVLGAEQKRLSARLRREIELDLAELAEADAARALESLRPPLCLFSPEERARGGSLQWTRAAAGAVLELLLGGEPSTTPRGEPLSAIERDLLAELLRPTCRALASACGTSFAPGALRQHEEERDELRRELEGVDPQRLVLALTVSGVGEPSHLRLALAGVPPGEDGRDAPPTTLPAHLARVEVELSARLGSLELPLAEVLALRVGDVLALELEQGAPLAVCLEDEPCLEADWGTKDGRLALRVRGSGARNTTTETKEARGKR